MIVAISVRTPTERRAAGGRLMRGWIPPSIVLPVLLEKVVPE
jgi:hypothetical protein